MGWKLTDHLSIKPDAAIGARIWYARHKAGLSQKQLAKFVRVNVVTVRRWETGHNTPYQYQVDTMSEALGVSVAWLLGETQQEDLE